MAVLGAVRDGNSEAAAHLWPHEHQGELGSIVHLRQREGRARSMRTWPVRGACV